MRDPCERLSAGHELSPANGRFGGDKLIGTVLSLSENVYVNIVGPTLRREAEVEAILRSLPRWFGIETALVMYVADSATQPTFGAEDAGQLIGFLSLRRHFEHSWEVHCMAVDAPQRNAGVGTALLATAEEYVRSQRGRFLQVKTVAESSPSAEYAQTRQFYLAKGFTALEVFPTLWDPWNPALQLVKALDGRSS